MTKTLRWGAVVLALAGIGQQECPLPNQEVCNGEDDDMDGSVDELFDLDEDGFPDAASCPGLPPDAVDCDDGDPEVAPGADERCDAADDDCDGRADEGIPGEDADGDGVLACADCDDGEARRSPLLAEVVGDALDNDCDGESDADAWVSSGAGPEPGKPVFASLQQAIDAAEAGDVIGVGPGVWQGPITIGGGQLFLAAPAGRSAASIDGRGRGAAVTVSGGGHVELEGLTLTRGEADYGGALSVNGAEVVARGCALTSSVGLEAGGGASVRAGGKLRLEGCLVQGNEAYLGGGVFVEGAALTATGLVVDDNRAYALISSTIETVSEGGRTWTEVKTGYDGAGGGLYLGAGASATLSGSLISANTSMRGGGVYHDGVSLTVEQSTFSANVAWLPKMVEDARNAPNPSVETAFSGQGGGMLLTSPAALSAVTLEANQAVSGGGLWIASAVVSAQGVVAAENVGHAVIRRVEDGDGILDIYEGEGGAVGLTAGASLSGGGLRISGGRAIYGAGIYASQSVLSLAGLVVEAAEADAVSVDDSQGGSPSRLGSGGGLFLVSSSVNLSSVVLHDTRARDSGGGMMVVGGAGAPRLVNATVVGASARTGGGLRFESVPASWSVKNVIVAFTAEGGGISGSLPSSAFTYCDVFGNTGGDWIGTPDPGGASGNLAVDPRFVAFTPGGDPAADDLRLAGGSPAVDTGDPDAAYLDLDGSRADMGAYGGPAAGGI